MPAALVTTQRDDSAMAGGATVSPYLIRSAIVASFCGLLFGFEIAVISGATDWLKTHFALSSFMLGAAVASGLIGAIVGSIAVAKPTDALGRRGVLFSLAALFLVASIGCALAWDLPSFMLFRFLGGLAVGGASVVAPVYIAELSPAAYRGRLVTIQQLNIVVGILLAYLSNYVIGRLDLAENETRWMFGIMEQLRKGEVQTDGAKMYPGVFKNRPHITRFECTAHLRRYVLDAIKANELEAIPLLRDISTLYQLERQAEALGFSHTPRGHWRHAKANPILKRLHQRFRLLDATPGTVGNLREAMTYAINRWPFLVRYAKAGFGHISTDQNFIERCFKPTRVGLRNFLFIGHSAAGLALRCHL
jgi:Sugar (and other) transporter/Transposase IS66 family